MENEILGYYYLHVNGNLIWKRYIDDKQEEEIYNSDLVKKFWTIRENERESLWAVAIEAYCWGNEVTAPQVEEFSIKHNLSNLDGEFFAERAGMYVAQSSDSVYTVGFIGDIGATPQIGTGKNALKAFIDLARPALINRNLPTPKKRF